MGLIFRQRRTAEFAGLEDQDFVLVDSPAPFLRFAPELAQNLGPSRWMKYFLKALLPHRGLFFIHAPNGIVARGELWIGRCKHYPVEPDAVVVGSIWTDERVRNQGLATRAIKNAMNQMLRRGHTQFYIDTQPTNAPMLHSIAKLGFGDHVGTFEG